MRFGTWPLGVEVWGLRFWGEGVGVWVLECGWWVVWTHTQYKFTHQFLMMLFLVTIWCCLYAR